MALFQSEPFWETRFNVQHLFQTRASFNTSQYDVKNEMEWQKNQPDIPKIRHSGEVRSYLSYWDENLKCWFRHLRQTLVFLPGSWRLVAAKPCSPAASAGSRSTVRACWSATCGPTQGKSHTYAKCVIKDSQHRPVWTHISKKITYFYTLLVLNAFKEMTINF